MTYVLALYYGYSTASWGDREGSTALQASDGLRRQ